MLEALPATRRRPPRQRRRGPGAGTLAIVLVAACNLGDGGAVNQAPKAARISEPIIDRTDAVNASAARTGVSAQGPAERVERKLNPQDALVIVEQSKLQFVAPQRKGKVKMYSGPEFSDMLRRKWDWLGSDIEDMDRFIEEIATDAFSTFEPYRIRHADGREQDFSTWLRARLQERGAGGGSPAEPEPAAAPVPAPDSE